MAESGGATNVDEVARLLQKVHSLRSELSAERARSLAASEHFYAEQETALKAYEDLERRNTELVEKYDKCRETVVAQLARLGANCENCHPWEKDEAQKRKEVLSEIVVRQQEKLKELVNEKQALKRNIGTLLMKFLTCPDVQVDLDHAGLKPVFDLLGEDTAPLVSPQDGVKQARIDSSIVKNGSGASNAEDRRKVAKTGYLNWLYPERKSGESMVV